MIIKKEKRYLLNRGTYYWKIKVEAGCFYTSLNFKNEKTATAVYKLLLLLFKKFLEE